MPSYLSCRGAGRRAMRCLGTVSLVAVPLSVNVAAPAPEPVTAPLRAGTSREAVETSARRQSADALIESMVPPRSDSPADWQARPLFLHACGEPRKLAPCVPPAPCHPAYPPQPFDLIGVAGAPTCGPRYRGPCEPRLGTHDHGPWPRLHALHDAAFDTFYR